MGATRSLKKGATGGLSASANHVTYNTLLDKPAVALGFGVDAMGC